MNKLSKRGWQGYDTLKEGKWFTGFSGDIVDQESPAYYGIRCVPVEHEVRELHLRPVQLNRGRSAAYTVWEDKEGFLYRMSFSGVFEMLKLALTGKVIPRSDKLLCGIRANFVQSKQGANYFIELADYEV